MENNKITIKYIINSGLIFIAVVAGAMLLPMIASAQNIGTYQGYNTTTFNSVPQDYNYGYNTYAYNNNNYNNNYANTVPSIYSISPNEINRNGNTAIVVVSGNNFNPSSVVKINGIDHATNYVNNTRLEVPFVNTNSLGAGNFAIFVYNSNDGRISNSLTIRIINNQVSTTSTKSSTAKVAVAKKSTTTTAVAPTKKVESAGDGSMAANLLFGFDGGNFMPSSLVQWVIFFIFILLIVFLWRQVFIAEEHKHKPLKHA